MFNKYGILIGIYLVFVSTFVYSSPLPFELQKNIDYVQTYLENSDHEDSERHLTSLLRGMTGIEVSIYFRTNSATVDKRSRTQIYDIAKTVLVYPMVNLSISGRTDSRGTETYNLQLAEKRVDAVLDVFKDALAPNNYDPKRFYPLARGESFATSKPNDKEGMSLERRVIIRLLVQWKLPGK